MARAPLCHPRCPKDKIFLRVRILGSVPVSEPEIRGRYHRELPRRRYQYVHMSFIRYHIHMFLFFSLGERLSLDALASNDPQKTPQRSNRVFPPRGVPVL